MEDKQIYTTARSEELKRELISLRQKIRQKLSLLKKKSVKQEPQRVKQDANIQYENKQQKTKGQNIQINMDSQKLKGGEGKIHLKKPEPSVSEQSLYAVFVYTLFAIIILIIAISVYLSYFTQRW